MKKNFWTVFFTPGLNLPNLVTAVACLVIFVMVVGTDSSDLASWVQAVGSVVAIAFAAYLPGRHAEIALKRRHESLAKIMRVIADDAVESLFMLSNAFLRPERESQQMARYQNFHRGREWLSLIEQVAQIPVAELTPKNARELSQLKDAINFGAFVAEQIPNWIKAGGVSKPDVLRVLRAKRDLAALIRSGLPGPEGIFSHKMTPAQAVASLAELHRPPIEPMQFPEGDIYRRYVWDNEADSVPSYVYITGVFTYFDGFGPSVIEKASNWRSFDEAEWYVREMCKVLYNEHMEGVYLKMTKGALEKL